MTNQVPQMPRVIPRGNAIKIFAFDHRSGARLAQSTSPSEARESATMLRELHEQMGARLPERSVVHFAVGDGCALLDRAAVERMFLALEECAVLAEAQLQAERELRELSTLQVRGSA